MAAISKEEPLSSSHLQICLKLAAALARQSQLNYDRPENVKLPDSAGVLWPLEHLYFVEPQFAGWLSGDKLPEAMHLVHPEISPELASQLHVQSLRQIHEVRFCTRVPEWHHMNLQLVLVAMVDQGVCIA